MSRETLYLRFLRVVLILRTAEVGSASALAATIVVVRRDSTEVLGESAMAGSSGFAVVRVGGKLGQKDTPSRPEAIRRVVEKGLKQ